MGALTVPRYPRPPASLVRRILPGTVQRIFGGCMGPSGDYWVNSYAAIQRSADGLAFTSKITTSGIGTISESIYINSAGFAFWTTDASGTATNIGKLYVSTDANVTALTEVLCEDGATPFVGPVAQTSTQGWHFTQWGVKEVKQDVGLLKAGDIIMGTYHRSTSASVKVGYIYVIRNVGGVWTINADASVGLMNPYADTDGMLGGDPFGTWNASTDHGGRAQFVRHIHAILPPDENGWVWFTCGDNTDGTTGFMGDDPTLGYYRLCRINVAETDGQWECLTPDNGNKGYTALFRRADGNVLAGVDCSPSLQQATPPISTIDLYDGATGKLLRVVYTPSDAGIDGPIWDIVNLEGTQEFYATVERQSGALSRAGLLYSHDNGETWQLISRSALNKKDHKFRDYDRLLHYEGVIPAGAPFGLISCQPESATDWTYYTVEL